MIEEYKSLRDEISKTLVNRLTIISLGLVAVGALIGFAAKNPDGESTIISALVLGIMVPATAFMAVFLWISEVRRGRRASWYLWGLERRINKELGKRVLRWEEDIRPPEASKLLRLFRGHYYVIILFFTVIGGGSAYFGSVALNLSTCLSFLWAAAVTAAMLAIFIPECIRLSGYDKPDSNWPERLTD